jgi:phosphoribosylaminoimidazole (AIR) synthetase
MGIGFVVICSHHFADSIVHQLEKLGEKAFRIGEVVPGETGLEFAKRSDPAF